MAAQASQFDEIGQVLNNLEVMRARINSAVYGDHDLMGPAQLKTLVSETLAFHAETAKLVLRVGQLSAGVGSINALGVF